MDFLLTVIGNAAVDSEFRIRLLVDPVQTINAWGLRLTKGEVEMAEAMFGRRQNDLEQTFQALEDVLYENLDQVITTMCKRPCRMSLSRPNPLPTIDRMRPRLANGGAA